MTTVGCRPDLPVGGSQGGAGTSPRKWAHESRPRCIQRPLRRVRSRNPRGRRRDRRHRHGNTGGGGVNRRHGPPGSPRRSGQHVERQGDGALVEGKGKACVMSEATGRELEGHPGAGVQYLPLSQVTVVAGVKDPSGAVAVEEQAHRVPCSRDRAT